MLKCQLTGKTHRLQYDCNYKMKLYTKTHLFFISKSPQCICIDEN